MSAERICLALAQRANGIKSRRRLLFLSHYFVLQNFLTCFLLVCLTRFQYLVAFGGHKQESRPVYRVSVFVNAARLRPMVVTGAEFLSVNIAIAFEDKELLEATVPMSWQRGSRRHSYNRGNEPGRIIHMKKLHPYPVSHIEPFTLVSMNGQKSRQRSRSFVPVTNIQLGEQFPARPGRRLLLGDAQRESRYGPGKAVQLRQAD